MKFLIVLVALFAIQGCMAKPKAKPSEAAVDKNHLEELAQNAQKLAKDVGEKLGLADLDSKKIADNLNENTNKLLDNIKIFVDKVQAEGKAHEGEFNDGIKKVQEKLTATVADLQKAAGPDATKKAEEIKVEFNKAYKTATDQVQQLVKTYEPDVKGAQENIQKFSKNLLEQLVGIGKNIETNVKTALEEHEKTHPK